MIFKIIWSEFAESQLDEIFNYYKKEASLKVAKKLLIDIINEPKKLTNTLEIGFIKIADVFDTRQNPPKIKRTE